MAFQDLPISQTTYVSIKAFIKGNLIDIFNFEEFKYVYKIDGPDECTFTVKDSNISIADSPELQEKVELRLVWGYAGGPFSKTKKVFIENIKYRYVDYGIEISIIALDKSSNLAKGKKKKVYTNKTIDEIAEEVAKDNGVNYSPIVFGETEEDATVYGFLDTDGKREAFKMDNGFGSFNYIPAIDNTSVKKFAIFEKKLNYVQATNTDKYMLDDLLNNAEGGPYILDTDGDTISINTKRLSSKPVKSYIWKGEKGELLSFEPESKNRTGGAKATKVTSGSWNEEDKEFFEGSATELTDDNHRLAEEVELPPDENTVDLSIEPTDAELAENDLNYAYVVPIKINTATESFKTTTLDGFHNYIPAVENTSIQIQTFDFFNPLEYGDYIAGKGTTEKAVGPSANNTRTNNVLESNPGSCEILGDPALEDNMVITISNVAKKHEGNYLITEREHLIGSTYIVSCKIKRNGRGSVSQNDPTKVTVDTINKELNNQVGPDAVDTREEIEQVEPEDL